MTITEALAEIKTIDKRIRSKQEFIRNYIMRMDNVKDPLEKDGGSFKVLEEEMQAIGDLEKRIVELRRGIQSANEKTKVSLEGLEMSIADWLIWRREVLPGRRMFLNALRSTMSNNREAVRRNSWGVKEADKTSPPDIVVNIDEKALMSELEKLGKIEGDLDGQLSLKNATVMIG